MHDAIACFGCDLLVDVHALAHGERAHCPRCGHFLTKVQSDAFSHLLAYTTAGLIFLAVACSYPFLSFATAGQESVITLPQTAEELFGYGMRAISLLVAAFIIVIPGVVMVLLVLLCLPLLYRRYTWWLPGIARWIFTLYNWAMVEVFIMGVIVSLVKLKSMATVTLGISFWAYIAFSLCFVLAFSNLDRYQCWQRIEQLERER